jgi:uncharacterized protein (TIGR03435 family)
MKQWMGVLAVAAMLAVGGAVGQAPASGMETLQPMAADADPSYAVATIKPSKPDEEISSIPPVGYRTMLPMITAAKLVSFAYDLQNVQVVGAPAWVGSETFDFDGVSDTPGRPDVKQLKTMLQKVLVDRFQLKFHWETRELLAYALVVGKKRARLTESKEDPQGSPTFFIRGNGSASSTLTAKNVEMGELAHLLQSSVVDRPVVDQTGLTGKYDFELTWADQSPMNAGEAGMAGADATGIFTAIQEQLGLKLSAEKTAVRVMVIDRVEQPSAN